MTLLLPAVSRSGAPLVDVIHCADIFDLCAALPDRSVDLIVSDLPYGTTACAWDNMIPFVPMWTAFKRIIKPKGAIVLTGSQPFTTLLNMSNFEWFRYEIIVEKDAATGFLNANRQPLKAHETISVFYQSQPTYNPQMVQGKTYRATSGAAGGHIRDKSIGGYETVNLGWRFPRSVVRFTFPQNPLHPTQKPTALFEYLIRTYTRSGDLVFDPCVGSGTTALAARNTGRHYICGDSSPEYVAIAKQRLAHPFTPSFLDVSAGESPEKHVQESLDLEVKS